MICEMIASLVVIGTQPTGPVYGPASREYSFFEEAKHEADCDRRFRVFAGEMCPDRALAFVQARVRGGYYMWCVDREWEDDSFQRRVLFLRWRTPVASGGEE